MSQLNVDTIGSQTGTTVSVASGHTLQDANGNAITSGGLTLIKNQSYSEVSTSGSDFDNVFTTTYDNYLLQVNDIQYFTAGEYLRFRFRTGGASGSDATLSTYRYAWEYQSMNNVGTGDRNVGYIGGVKVQ